MEKPKNLEENRYMQCCYKRCTLLWLFLCTFLLALRAGPALHPSSIPGAGNVLLFCACTIYSDLVGVYPHAFLLASLAAAS